MRRIKILVVEDEPLVRLDLEMILEEVPDAAPVFAADLQEGLAAAAESFDVAFLDYHLNGKRSDELAERLHQAGTRIVFISGHSLPQSRLDAFGAIYVPKPFSDAEILFALHSARRRDRGVRDLASQAAE